MTVEESLSELDIQFLSIFIKCYQKLQTIDGNKSADINDYFKIKIVKSYKDANDSSYMYTRGYQKVRNLMR